MARQQLKMVVRGRVSLLAVALLAMQSQGRAWSGNELGGHGGQVEGVAFSPDGRWLASADNSGTVLVRSVPAFEVTATLRGSNFTEVAWSADGTTLAAGGFDSLVYVWRAPFALPPRTFRYPGPVETVDVTPGGILVAAGGGDRAIHRWRLSSGAELASLRGHTDDVYVVRVSPDGRQLLSSGRDRTIRIWDVATGRPLRTLRGHDDSVYDVAFDTSRPLLVSACRDGSVGIWSTRTWTLQRTQRGPANSVHGVAVSRGGVWLAAAGFDNHVWIWPLANPAARGMPLAGHRQKVSGVAFSPDGAWLASASSDSTVRAWRVP